MRFSSQSITLSVGILVVTAALACGGASPTIAPTPPERAAPAAVPPAQPAAQPTATATPDSPTAVAAPAEQAAFAWAVEDIEAGTKPALALTSDDVPYVAYMLEDQHGFVKSAVRDGSSWDIAIVAEGYFYGPLDIAIGPDDVVHISYHDHQDDTFKPDKGDAAYAVLKDDGWSVQAIFDEGHDGWDNRVAVDSQGRPYISAIDPEDFGGNGVEYYHQDGPGNWVVESVGTGPLTYKYATSIALDPQGNPHITYFDQGNKDLALASREDGEWNISMVDSDGDTGLFPSLLIDEDGRYHISYLQRTSPTSGIVKYATRGPDDPVWEIRQVDTLNKLTFGFVGARNITSVALDSEGTPWIAYSDEKKLKLAIWRGSQWQTETVVDAGLKTLGQLVSLKLDSSGHPHIAYFQVTNKRPLEGRIKYVKGTPR